MASCKKSRRIPLWLYSMVLGLVLLLGAGSARAQIRTVLVSPVPGNPTASGTALRNALAGISSPSATNRWLVKIEPGIYDIGTTGLQMRAWVDMEGSGIGMTTVRGSAYSTIYGANNAELRLLTVEAPGAAQGAFTLAMENYSASPRLYRVKFSVTGSFSGGVAYGVRNVNSAPRIEECEISVGGVGNASYGVVFRSDCLPLPAIRSSILRSQIVVSGATNPIGVFLANAQFVSEIRDSRIDVSGGETTYGLYGLVDDICPWQGHESLRIRNTEVSSSGGSSASYGIKVESPATIDLDIVDSRIWGHVSPTTYGIKQGGVTSFVLQSSDVVGYTQTVQTAGSASIESTRLAGGPATAQGWIGCMGVWDENAIFYAQGACP